MQDPIVQTVDISPKRLLTLLLGADIGLAIAGLLSNLFIYFSDKNIDFLMMRFNLGAEESLPTWYSSFQLLICAALLLLIGLRARKKEEKFSRHWLGLSLLFLYISIDEIATFRESVARLSKTYVDTSGLFYYTWVIVAIPAVALLAILYAKFVFQLPKQVRNLVILSGGIFLSGAIGLEMVTALIHSSSGSRVLAEASPQVNLAYSLVTTVEETLEIVGVTIFLYALSIYIKLERITAVRFRIAH
ncbi:MAG: hypothetical protein WBA10_11405 [Elainellaceae cyanobacterium]